MAGEDAADNWRSEWRTPGLREYTEAVGKVRLLTAEEERILGAAVREGREADRSLETGGDEAGRLVLLDKVRRGRVAWERLVESNLRWVMQIAKRYMGRGVPLEDLIGEGNLGLMAAVDHFDERKGYRFTTYASWWIRQAVRRALHAQQSLIRLPEGLFCAVDRAGEVGANLREELGREPMAADVATALGLGELRLLRAWEARRDPISLDLAIDADGGGVLGERIEDPQGGDPADEAIRHTLCGELMGVLNDLPVREAKVLVRRYLEDEETLEDIGQLMGCTRERVRQMEGSALAHLRHDPRIVRLYEAVRGRPVPTISG